MNTQRPTDNERLAAALREALGPLTPEEVETGISQVQAFLTFKPATQTVVQTETAHCQLMQ